MAPESDSGGTPSPITSSRPLVPARASASRCGVAAASNAVRPPSTGEGRSPPPHSAITNTRPGRGLPPVPARVSATDARIDPALLDHAGHGRWHEAPPVPAGGDDPAHAAAADRLVGALPHHLGAQAQRLQPAQLRPAPLVVE